MKEEDIRPKKIFDEYLALAEKDAEIYFKDALMQIGLCPACEKKGRIAFEKHGFTYELCQNCKTLYVNPRPESIAFTKYYTESESSKFWATTFYKETAEARVEKLWRPKALLINQKLESYGLSKSSVIDIGGGYGLFADEMSRLSGLSVTVIEPSPFLASACIGRGLPVIQKFLEGVEEIDLPYGLKVFVSFELFEHLHDPAKFLTHLNKIMSGGDYFIFTTLSGAGLDIQVLWEHSKSVMPPHHLNFFNPASIKLLLERIGFNCLEISTPGKLDIDILQNNQDLITDRFWKSFIETSTAQERSEWQDIIVKSDRSSHMMVICQKIDSGQ